MRSMVDAEWDDKDSTPRPLRVLAAAITNALVASQVPSLIE